MVETSGEAIAALTQVTEKKLTSSFNLRLPLLKFTYSVFFYSIRGHEEMVNYFGANYRQHESTYPANHYVC